MSNRSVVVTTTLFAALLVAALTGCTAPDSGAVETSAAERPVATPSAEPTAAAGPVCRRPGGDGTISTGEPLNVELYSEMHDYGPREGANGTVAYAPDGTLASYVVAPGDHDEAILERLCVGPYSLEALNAVRRGSVHSVDPTSQAYLTPLYAGDTLNLNPYTITSIGDVNGEVRSYEASFILPPQR